MTIHRHRPALILALAWATIAAPAAADCDPAGPLEDVLPDAPVVFVGTVTALDGPIATFAVAEVWAGEVARTVTVRGLFDGVGRPGGGAGAGFSEDDREWSEGETYLVVPWVDGAALRDSICTATSVWRPELEPLRPADARHIDAAEPADAAPPAALILAAVIAVLVAGASVFAFRRR